jgi:meiotically up-regulated gene 157 (Mug157) protein
LDGQSQRLTQKMEALHQEMEAGLRGHAIGNQKDESDIMAFEVDGFGSKYFTDDANIPSLLSLPYLGYMEKDDPLYLRTREFLLSENNPHNYKSTVTGFNGIGGPHVGWGHIWPMAITIQAITSTDDDEIMACLEQLKATDAGTYFMHETFWMDDADRFSRSWFAWANTLFGELIIELAEEKPHLIFKDTDPTLECVPTGLGNEMEEITEAWCQENCFDGDGVLAPACEPNSGFVLCECN